MEFVNSILDSIGAIARGQIGIVADKVEGALAKALPLAISFLASLLGLGGITRQDPRGHRDGPQADREGGRLRRDGRRQGLQEDVRRRDRLGQGQVPRRASSGPRTRPTAAKEWARRQGPRRSRTASRAAARTTARTQPATERRGPRRGQGDRGRASRARARHRSASHGRSRGREPTWPRRPPRPKALQRRQDEIGRRDMLAGRAKDLEDARRRPGRLPSRGDRSGQARGVRRVQRVTQGPREKLEARPRRVLDATARRRSTIVDGPSTRTADQASRRQAPPRRPDAGRGGDASRDDRSRRGQLAGDAHDEAGHASSGDADADLRASSAASTDLDATVAEQARRGRRARRPSREADEPDEAERATAHERPQRRRRDRKVRDRRRRAGQAVDAGQGARARVGESGAYRGRVTAWSVVRASRRTARPLEPLAEHGRTERRQVGRRRARYRAGLGSRRGTTGGCRPRRRVASLQAGTTDAGDRTTTSEPTPYVEDPSARRARDVGRGATLERRTTSTRGRLARDEASAPLSAAGARRARSRALGRASGRDAAAT